MSTLGDTVTALKNVILMAERIEATRAEIIRLSRSVSRMADELGALDRRLVRIETVLDMIGRVATAAPAIEAGRDRT